MAAKKKERFRGTGRRAEIRITGTITIGASGAVASQSSELATAVKNAAAGRYDLTFDRAYIGSARFVGATISRPDTTSFGNTNGNQVNGQVVGNASATLQVVLASSGVDTNPASGMVIGYEFAVKEI